MYMWRHLCWIVPIFHQSLHNEYDKLENDYDQEKKQRQRLEADLAKVVEELTDLKMTLSQMKDDKEKMEELIEEYELDSKVSEKCTLHCCYPDCYQACDSAETRNSMILAVNLVSFRSGLLNSCKSEANGVLRVLTSKLNQPECNSNISDNT